jgi:hypothetical protein
MTSPLLRSFTDLKSANRSPMYLLSSNPIYSSVAFKKDKYRCAAQKRSENCRNVEFGTDTQCYC